MTTKNISLPLAVLFGLDLTRVIKKILKKKVLFKFNILFSYIGLLKERGVKRLNFTDTKPLNNRKFNFSSDKVKKILKPLLIILIVFVIAYFGANVVKNIGTSFSTSEKLEIGEAKATQEINREFAFPLKNSKGEKLGEVKYLIENAELRDEVVVQGKKAVALKGRTFLVLTIKIKNDYKEAIEIDTTDYVRLSVNGNEEEWLAPDFNNDPVKVQAISTKPTRIGFTINESDENLLITVGELEADKERIELKF